MKKEETRVNGTVTIEGAELIFKNFQGKQGDFNEEGNRNFGVLLDEDLAVQLESDGWNVKRLKPREDDPEQYEQPWLPCKVKYGAYPPVVVLINSSGKIRLDEETVGQLDWSRIKNADLIIRPYNYPAIAGRPAGVSAYLKALYVTIEEDKLESKYADVPYIGEEPEE